jgi:hypothetical protein
LNLWLSLQNFFEADSVEKATEAAHNQKMPDDNAKIEIVGKRFIRSNIKLTNDMDNDARTKDAQGSGIEATKDVRENV